MVKMIKQFIEKKKERFRLKDEANLRASFNVKERGGFLWMTYNGVAFYKIAAAENASEIVKKLDDARNCSVEFMRIWK